MSGFSQIMLYIKQLTHELLVLKSENSKLHHNLRITTLRLQELQALQLENCLLRELVLRNNSKTQECAVLQLENSHLRYSLSTAMDRITQIYNPISDVDSQAETVVL